ncbi:hypothetical protein FACS1894170_12540 [Planctomycetales bacterium]|nr:hypothetical protein FACS1894170_12540 [Planctomycetales bacterium]
MGICGKPISDWRYYQGIVRNLTNYGAFIELEEGIDGLLHVSDMSWVKKITHPNELVQKGQEIECMVLSIDKPNRRIALGMKQLEQDPWDKQIPEKYVPGLVLKGTVTKITNFGVFVSLEDDLEGLLHISELADYKVDNPEDVVKIGDEIEVKVLRLLELKKPSDYTEHFFDLNPEYQPDGKPTVETAKEYIAAAFETGYQRFEWMYKTATGKPLPVETTLVRVPWKGGYRLAAYSRDLRETKAKEQEIKETDERNRQLEIEKKAALRATQLRNEFLVNLSHEFLTPLNAIQGFTLCTLQTALTGQQRDWLGQVADATKTLSQVINNVLEISHLESGKCQLAHDRFSLHGIITKLKQSTAALIKNTLLTARITCQPDVPDELVGDAGRLEYILLSLVSNAVRFTPSGSISVNVQKCSDKLPDGTTVLPEDNTVVLLFSVQDTGIGMSAEVMDSLFYPFMQADTSARRTHSGTGVGLAICKNIIELMHGKIWCQSTPNVGSTFYFTVRLRCA